MPTSRSERASARRKVLKVLSSLKRDITTLQAWWDVRGTTYIPQITGGPSVRRDRRPDEYPEAQRKYWASTIARLDVMAFEIAELRAHCLNEYNITPAPEDEPK